MLSHHNFATNVRDNGFDIREGDVCLSFLPLSHVAERTADYAFYYESRALLLLTLNPSRPSRKT